MSHRLAALSVLSALSLPLSSPLPAQTLGPEHPVIHAMAGSSLKGEPELEPEGEMTVTYRGDEGLVRKTVRGTYRYLEYEILAPREERDDETRNEVMENYEELVGRLDGTIRSKSTNRMIFSVPYSGGGMTWCRLWASREDYTLEIVDEAVAETSTSAIAEGENAGAYPAAGNAEEMRALLETQGHVAVAGIAFEPDQSILGLGSGAVLDQMASLFLSDPQLHVEILAFADPQTAPAERLGLSVHRAETIVDALTLYGIDGSRLIAKGTAEASDEGLTLELVRVSEE